MIEKISKLILCTLLSAAAVLPVAAQQAATVNVSVKNHRFQPAEIHAPAKVPIEP